MNPQNQTKSRTWLVEAEPVVIDADQPDVLYEELAECLMLLRRVGGAVTIQTQDGNLVIGAAREQSDEYPDVYVTRAFVFRWVPSLPAIRRPEPEAEYQTAAESEAPVLEPVES